MSFTKEVSASDRFFAVYNELCPPFIIQLTIEGDGDPDPEALDDALTRATAVNPGSAMRIDQAGAEPMWVAGPPPPLTVVDVPEWSGDRSSEAAPFLGWRLDAFEGPCCELVLARGANKRYLVFRALHAAMDGRGTLAWAKDVLRCLRGEAPLGHPSTLTVDQLVRELGSEKRPSPPIDALHPYGLAKGETRGSFHWRRFVVPQPLDAGATGRIAVRLAEQARTHGEGAVRVNLPTDLRYLRPKERTTGNLFNALFIDVPPDATPDQIGMKVMQMLYKKEGARPIGIYGATNYVGSIAVHRVKLLWDVCHLHDTGRYSFSLTLSHLGALASEELSAPSFRATGAYFVPLVGDSGCVLSVNGFDERTEACVGLSDRFGDAGTIDHLAELVRAAIAED